MIKNNYDKENPFYHNYLFSKKDIERPKLRWWQLPIIIWPFLTTYVQINDGYVFHYKTYNNQYYFKKAEALNWNKEKSLTEKDKKP